MGAFGNPSDPDTFSHLFSKPVRKAGFGHWHPHGLRHSGGSLMLAQGTPLYVVLDVLGHASIAIIKDVYGHSWRATSGRRRRPFRASPAGETEAGGSRVAPTDTEGTGRGTKRERLLRASCLFRSLLRCARPRGFESLTF
ncbi:tyrosine-type recombinase/integrase [Streptosporangium sp. NPDC004631]